ncbi:MAG: gliding motility-associated C-terminal domain-containing protein, partial [Flavobacteriaceae bacterium]
TQQAIDAGGVSNTVTVVASSPGKTNDIFDISDDGDDTDGNIVNDPTITRITTTPPPSSSITLTKAASIADTNGDGSIGIGDTITYTLVATNTGNDALSSVSITDVLSDLAGNTLSLTTLPTFISASLGSLEGSLQVGEQATYRATFVVNSQAMNAGGVSNTATVTAQGTNGGTISDTSDDPSTSTPNDATIIVLTTVTPQSSIEVTKTATIVDNGNGTTGLGDTITFLITVENTGSTALNGIVVNDTFSDLSGNALALTTEPLFVSANLGSVEGTLLSGETAFYTATFIVNAQADNAGGVSNTASATATTPSGNTITDASDDGDDTDGNTTNDPTVVAFFQNPVDGDFEVYNGMSPGSDGFNDYFKIAGIEKYPNNTVKIFNRWGVVVYEAKGYGIGDKLFMGISEGRITITKNQKLPEGTYFYVIEFEGDNPGRERYTGYLYINRD